MKLVQLTDIDTLMCWRREVIREVFGVDSDETLDAASRNYYIRNVGSGGHFAIVAKVGEQDAGCGALCFQSELPSPDNPSGLCAYLMNIYVREPFRGRGVGRAVVARLLEEARRRGCAKISLETTASGRQLYEHSGFVPANDMMIYDKNN